LPRSEPKIFFASCTAAELTLIAPWPSAVSLRTRPPTSSAVWKSRFSTAPDAERLASHASRTCPWICASPTTIESIPETTRKRCAIASRSRRT
jgi:hypothetical protein